MPKLRVSWSHAGHAQVTVHDDAAFRTEEGGHLGVFVGSEMVAAYAPGSWHTVSPAGDDEELGTRPGNPIAMPRMSPPGHATKT